MPSDRAFVLCHYRYDPLDRIVGTSPSGQSPLQRFYCKARLATEIQGLLRHTIVQHDDQLLAQQQRNGEHVEATLLATDLQRSVLHALSAGARHPIAYSPYGHHPADSGLLSVLGFHGERRDPVTGHYVLGNGYRAFNPVLMRFNSPDSWSPFGIGGLNAYAYCMGNPHRQDPTGHMPLALPPALPLLMRRNSSPAAVLQVASARNSDPLAISSINRVTNNIPAPSTGSITIQPFNYRLSDSGPNRLQSANRRGSVESLTSTSSLNSSSSSESIPQSGSTGSINAIDWSTSNSPGTPPSNSGRRAPSIDSGWSVSVGRLSHVQVGRAVVNPPIVGHRATIVPALQPLYATTGYASTSTPTALNVSVRHQ